MSRVCNPITPAITINLDWKLPLNLDLGALCIADNGDRQLICHENVGSRLSWPFAHLAHQSTEIGRVKHRREHLVITNCSASHKIFVAVWDKHALDDVSDSDFCRLPGECSIRVHTQDNTSHLIEFTPLAGNIVLAAVISRFQLETIGMVGRAGASLEWDIDQLIERSQC